jgi:GrpB-like predicted nucleotidyltransferase (UPF0157 family)
MSAEEDWVEVSPYNADWPVLFAAEAATIRSQLGTPGPEVVHFGSTAVPGLAAKPIVDILVGIEDRIEVETLGVVLQRMDYQYLGEDGRRPGRFFWRKRAADSFNVSSVPLNGPLWISNLAVRDFLREHDNWAHRYTEVKLDAVRSAASSMLHYQDAKRAFVDELRSAALSWDSAR